MSLENPVNREEALAHIEAFRSRIGWNLSAEEVPAPKQSSGEPIRERKPESPKRYERCALCENVLAAHEQTEGACDECLRKYQTPPVLFGGKA